MRNGQPVLTRAAIGISEARVVKQHLTLVGVLRILQYPNCAQTTLTATTRPPVTAFQASKRLSTREQHATVCIKAIPPEIIASRALILQ